MMKTETIQLLRDVREFDELSEQSKEKARDWYREGMSGDSYFSESVIELAETAGAILGIDIDKVYWSGFSCQGDGASFTGRYRYRKGWKKALAAEFRGELFVKLATIGDELQAVQKPTMYSGSATITHSGRYSHSGCMRFDCEVEYGDLCDFEPALSEALRDFANWIYRQLESEYDYTQTDEYVTEAIEANEYEFDESGRIA